MARPKTFFRGKHALITGGSSGIGLSLAEQLVDLNASVTLVARRPEPLARAADRLLTRRSGAVVNTLALDVSDETAVAAEIPHELAARPVDVLINAAGISNPALLLEAAPSDLREQMEINYWGTVWVSRAALPHLVEHGGGNVVILGSLAGRIGVHGYAGYAPAKAALVALADVLRAEFSESGIRVTVATPSNTETAMLEHELDVAPEPTKRVLEKTNILTADKVATAVLRAVAHGWFSVTPGLEARLQATGYLISPRIGRAVVDRMARG